MKELIKEIKRFIIVGLVSNALNFLVYAFLYKIGTTIWIASAFGYIVGLSNSFYFGKTWVFNPERVVYKHAIIKFILIYGFGGVGMALTVTMLDSLTVMDYRVIWFLESFLHF